VGRVGARWVAPLLPLTVPITLVAALVHFMATASNCGFMDGGPDAGEEAFCDSGLLYIPTTVGIAVLRVG
jgi:hypothetical protein